MRRAARHDVCYRCEIAGVQAEPIHALLVNISPLGCMMRCSRAEATDRTVHFTLPVAGRREARIVWAMGGRIGVEFLQPIDAGIYPAMLEQLDRPGDEMGIY